MEEGLIAERSHISKWRTNLSDFANMVKAFIGSNYLGISFAFSQAGLVGAVVGLLFIASLTDHCCHLIVKCKYAAICKVINSQRASNSKNGDSIEDEENLAIMERQMKRNLTYGDVGKLALGNVGLFIVNGCVLLTQFGFCVGYFILLGNTFLAMFPLNTCDLIRNSTNSSNFYLSNCTENHQIKLIPNSELLQYHSLMYETKSPIEGNHTVNLMHNLALNILDYPSSVDNSSWTEISKQVYKKTAPSLKLLVLFPLPIFIIFAYIRKIRHLGPISIVANISIFVGCISVIIFLVNGFSLSKSWVLINIEELPVFFGLVSGAFEGIGTVIPIESSMEGNRHNFNGFLHGAIVVLSFVLMSFGVLGYLRFGTDVQQMINANLPTNSDFSLVVNICLSLGVILTFPLMLYPVLELIEVYTFTDGRICGPNKKVFLYEDADSYSANSTDSDSLIPQTSSSTNEQLLVAATISPEVAAWKRNFVRTFIVLVAAGLAVVFRNSFAYILAFVGGIGSTLLAFILPCIFHLKLNWTHLSLPIKLKDIIIIIIGATCGTISIYTTVRKLITNLSAD